MSRSSQSARKPSSARSPLSADEIDLRDGHVLTQEGKPGREFFVLVARNRARHEGPEDIADLKAGDWFGEIALLTHVPRTATVTATSPVRVLVVTIARFAARRDDAEDRAQSPRQRRSAARSRRQKLR